MKGCDEVLHLFSEKLLIFRKLNRLFALLYFKLSKHKFLKYSSTSYNSTHIKTDSFFLLNLALTFAFGKGNISRESLVTKADMLFQPN